ncbi:MAG: FkbM family methyltransferase, partial [Candidatus Wolfebacteria bacterium]|nr:FkbM family methyltransferase [Candidatus Wolfebacteria bacterium]
MFIHALRKLKRLMFPPHEKWRRIKFGIAKGSWFLVNRHSHMRIESGVFELPLAKYVRTFLKNAKVAYDLGAEMGYYSLAFMRLMGEGGKVYAFEANKERVMKFPELVRRNNAEGKMMVIEAYVTNTDNTNLHGVPNRMSLDSFVYKEGNPSLDVIKMDIEGEELNALQGAERTLKEYRPKLILEIHSRELAVECPAYLKKLGYTVQP